MRRVVPVLLLFVSAIALVWAMQASPMSLEVVPAEVHQGESYAVWWRSTVGGDSIHSVLLDGVSWYTDYLAGRHQCAETPDPCVFWRGFTAGSPGQITHTTTGNKTDGTPWAPVSLPMTILATPTYADGWETATMPSGLLIYHGIASSGGVVLATDAYSNGNQTRVSRSTDYGQTFGPWTTLSGGTAYLESPVAMDGSLAIIFAVDATQTITDYCCARQVGPIVAFRSTDAGATWASRQTVSAAAKGLRLSTEVVGSTAYVAWMDWTGSSWDTYLSRSTDSGQTWSQQVIATGVNAVGAQRPTLAVSGSTVLVAWLDDRDGKPACTIEGGSVLPTCTEIYAARSTDGGATFTASARLTTTPGYAGRPDIALDGTNATLLYDWRSGYLNQTNVIAVLESTDGGQTWTGPTVLDDHPAEQTHGVVQYVNGQRQTIYQDARTGVYQIRAKQFGAGSQRLTSGQDAAGMSTDGSYAYVASRTGNQFVVLRRLIGPPPPPPPDPCVDDPLTLLSSAVGWPTEPAVTSVIVTQVGRTCAPLTVVR